jgi:hypothetical protein
MKKLYFVLISFFFLHSLLSAQCPGTLTLSMSSQGACDGCALVSGGVAPYSYMWSDGSTGLCLNASGPGVYYFTVVDAAGCLLTDSITITHQVSINVTSTPAFCRNGTATVNITAGTPPFLISWNTNPVDTHTTVTGLIANQSYTVSVVDDSGCVVMQSVTIGTPSNLSASIVSNPDTCTHGVGSATGFASSGVPPYSYLWNTNDTVPTISNITGSLFLSLTITDDSGCTAFSSVTIANYTPLQATVSITQPGCTDQTGVGIVSVSGGTPAYNYFWNTNPVQTSDTAINLGTGQYNLLITDQQGCTSSNTIVIADNSPMIVSVSALPDTCLQHVGYASVNASNAIPPLTYSWNPPVSNQPVATGLGAGWYYCTVTDSAGCVRTDKAYVSNYSPVSIQVFSTDATCIFTADGEAIVFANGGIPPYTYNWPGGNVPSVNNLLPGIYQVRVTDNQGCYNSYTFNIGYDSVLPCAVIVQGTVFSDLNLNCVIDPGESPLTGVRVQCLPIGGIQYTDFAGNYEFILPPGTYTTSQYFPPWYVQNCPAGSYTDTLPVVGMIATDNFADNGTALDLRIFCNNIIPPRPGFDYVDNIYYENQGSIIATNAVIKVYHDTTSVFISSNPAPANYNLATRELTYNIASIGAFGTFGSSSGSIQITYHIPANILIGTQISSLDSIFPVIGDTVAFNNTSNCFEYVVGSFDPNSIEVHPEGSGLPGYILPSDSILTYTVHFQNTGNYPANEILIKVQLDNDLDLTSAEFIGSSLPFTATISPAGLMTLTFVNIYLPDSTLDEPGSHGFVSFMIRLKPSLVTGTVINASAEIYFDFNSPIITNTTVNTITGITPPELITKSFKVYPNPSHNNFYISIESESKQEAELILSDVTGRICYNSDKLILLPGHFTHEINTAGLSPGIYIVQLLIGEQLLRKKIILN